MYKVLWTKFTNQSRVSPKLLCGGSAYLSKAFAMIKFVAIHKFQIDLRSSFPSSGVRSEGCFWKAAASVGHGSHKYSCASPSGGTWDRRHTRIYTQSALSPLSCYTASTCFCFPTDIYQQKNSNEVLG